MQKDDLVYLGHMLDMARKAVDKAAGTTRDEFDGDEDLRIVLTHLIQVVGEAAARVSVEFKHRNARIPWRAIVGMRHKIVHDYMHVNYDLVWDAATVDLPPLVAELEKIVPPDESPSRD